VDLLTASNDVRLVAQALGHSDVRVTMKYTERTDEDVALAIELKNGRKKGAQKEEAVNTARRSEDKLS
jgi:integrase